MLLTLGAVLWQAAQDKQISEYLNCVNLAALGVRESSCEIYRPYIAEHTNIYDLTEELKSENLDKPPGKRSGKDKQ